VATHVFKRGWVGALETVDRLLLITDNEDGALRLLRALPGKKFLRQRRRDLQ
jgi:hypothetical protein